MIAVKLLKNFTLNLILSFMNCITAATYNISMRLGEVNGSGTDGNVYIQLFGEEGNTAKIQLRQSGDMSNKFETGELYKFTVATVDIGKVRHSVFFL